MIEWYAIAVSAVIGIAGLAYARVAHGHAREANDLAANANEHAARAIELAESAEERADRLEKISRERRDVSWQQQKPRDRKILSFKNVGTDNAYNVELFLDPPEHEARRTQQLATVPPADHIGIDVSDLVSAAQRRSVSMAESGVFVSSAVVGSRARIVWTSESGVAGVQDWPDIEF